MASTGGGGHGGKRAFSGRNRKFSNAAQRRREWDSSHKKIYLNKIIFPSRDTKQTRLCASHDNVPLTDNAKRYKLWFQNSLKAQAGPHSLK